MLTKRIIPCLDVKDGKVVKGIQFKNHEVMGDIIDLAQRYKDQGADELVFYDISASPENRSVSRQWIKDIATILDIPFCVAGGIKTVEDAKEILGYGADKISINTPALNNPNFISELAEIFGSQCIVVGIDSKFEENEYYVYKYTGSESTIRTAKNRTLDWAKEAMNRGAGEIVLNCMNQDGMGQGYELEQLNLIREGISIPLIASGGAGCKEHFLEVFKKTGVDGALAAGVFHRNEIKIPELKFYLQKNDQPIRI